MPPHATTLNESSELVAFSGNAEDFGNRDLRKWVYSTYKCIKDGYEQPGINGRGGETWTYCVVLSEQQPTRLHGLCLPPTRRWDEFAIGAGAGGAGAGAEGSLICLDCSGYGCRPEDYPSGVLYAFVYAYFAVLAVLCWLVVKSWWTASSDSSSLLSAFSPKRNFAALFAPRAPGHGGGITCLDGLRVVALLWTVVGHVFMLLQGFVPNGEEVGDAISDNPLNLWLNNFTLSTDLFFTLSGCVCVYNGMGRGRSETPTMGPSSEGRGNIANDRDEGSSLYLRTSTTTSNSSTKGGGGDSTSSSSSYFSWLKRHYTHRLVRVWPALALSLTTLTVISFLLPFHLRPALSLFTKARACVYGGILRNLLFLNSIFPGPLCGGYTWHISTDFIFYAVLSPIALGLLPRNRRGFYAFVGALVVGSVVLNAAAISANSYPPTLMFWRQPTQFSPYYAMHFIDHYTKPWFRMGSYAVGMLLGAELRFYDDKRVAPTVSSSSLGHQHHHHQQQQRTLLIPLLLISWSIFGLYPAVQDWNCPTYHLIYGSVFRLAFSVGLALLIHACHTAAQARETTTSTSRLNSLLSSQLLLPFSALSYSLYTFTTTPVILALFVPLHPARFTGVMGLLPVCLGIITSGFTYALVCYLLVEKPAMQLEQLLRLRGAKEKKKE